MTENRDNKGKFIEGNTAGKRWQLGQSGNPAGRPKSSLTSIIEERLPQDSGNGKTYAQLIVNEIFAAACDRNDRAFTAAYQEILNRTDGKVADRHEIAGIMVHTTPELLQEARELYLQDQKDTQLLLNEFK